MEAHIRWIKEFFQARVADGQVGRDSNARLTPALAISNREFLEPRRMGGVKVDGLDTGGWRALRDKRLNKFAESELGTFQMNLHTCFVVHHPTG